MLTRNTTTSRITSASTSVTGSHPNQDNREWTQTMSSDESEPGSSNNDSDSDVSVVETRSRKRRKTGSKRGYCMSSWRKRLWARHAKACNPCRQTQQRCQEPDPDSCQQRCGYCHEENKTHVYHHNEGIAITRVSQWAMYIVQGHTEAEADVLVYRDLASFGDPAAENSRETGIAAPTEATPPGQSSSPATSSVPFNGPTNRVQKPDNGWIYNDVRTNS